jgi:hypothetical protein
VQRGATLSTQGVYKGGLGGGGEKREKIRKTNHPRGQPARCPGEKSKKKKVEKFLNRPRGVLETSIVLLTPNKKKKDCLNANRTIVTLIISVLTTEILNTLFCNVSYLKN